MICGYEKSEFALGPESKMPSIGRIITVNFLFCAALLWQPTARGQDDTVLRVSGGQLRGKIESASRAGVTMDGTQVPVTDIRYVMFAGEPPVLRQIRDAASKNRFAQAERYLERLNDAELTGELVKTDAEFYRVYVAAQRALQSGQGLAPAARQLVDFAKAHSTSFHFYDAAETLGELALALDKPTEAARYYGALEKAPLPGLKLRGMTRMAESYLARGEYAEALQRFAAILQNAKAPADRSAALLGKAMCQAELGQAEEGIATVEEIIANADPQDTALLARAYNALGGCYRTTGKNSAAVISYLHVDLLYPKHAEQHAEALYYLSQLWGPLGHADRARQARELLTSKYGGSAWAAK